MRARQLSFLPKISIEHGGETRKRRRKVARPIDPKRPLHLVMRSSRARGPYSMLSSRYERRITQIANATASKYDIRIRRFVNVGNHLHLIVQTRSRKAFQGFLREMSGGIAMLMTGARKAHPIDPRGRRRFWDHLAYTRVMNWGRDYENLKKYFIKNIFEAAGLLTPAMKAAGMRIFSASQLAGASPPLAQLSRRPKV